MDKNLQIRTITSLIGIPLLIVVVLVGHHAIAAFVVVMSGVVGFECARMLRLDRNLSLMLITTLVSLSLASYVSTLLSNSISLSLLYLSGVLAIWVLFWAVLALYLRSNKFTSVVVGCIAFGYMLSFAIQLGALEDAWKWVFLAIATPMAADSAAYFVGRRFGKRPLAKTISPKKTVEGLIGGVVAGVVVATLYTAVIDIGISFYWGPLIGLIQALVGAMGDLYESALKRAMDVKDSGTIVPGHGGVFDKIDSLAPNFVLVFLIFNYTV